VESPTVRVGVIGLGDIAVRAHLPAILQEPRAELVAAADLDGERLEPWVREGARGTTSAQELLEDPGVDAVIIATPSHATAPLTVAALEAGKHVLAEKPLAPTAAETAPVARVPGASERLQIGFTYRHHPAVERLRALVQGGELGSPLLVQVALCDEPATPESDASAHARRLRSLERAAPVVSDGIHACDRLLYVLGAAPVEVSGWSLRTDPAYASPNVNGGVLTYGDGSVARLDVVWLTPVLPPSQFVVTGPLGRATLDPPTFALDVLFADGRHEQHAPPGDKTEVCFRLQLGTWLGHVLDGTPPVPGLAEAMAGLELAERIALAGHAMPGVAA
jgi:myo-inositol 2-dehydrogenase / D-chiro-inositol 1-dehydrogenase